MKPERMKPERWQQRLYHAALEREASQRAAFLAVSCPDESLRREVESLLGYDARAEHFIEGGALEVASPLEVEEDGVTPLVGRQLGPYQVLSLRGVEGRGEVYRALDSRLDTLTNQHRDAIPGQNLVGRIVSGDYEVLSELGRGGMGVVYCAFDRKRKLDVALKTIRFPSPSALYRFKQEFRALAGVSHSNLVTLYELICHGQDWYVTMELVEGVNFRKYVRESCQLVVGHSTGRLPNAGKDPTLSGVGSFRDTGLTPSQLGRLREALQQLVEGVAALHAAGKLHRDIKPSNVIVTSQGRVVLLDFGLAAALDSRGMHQSSEQHLLGTAAYMAPEQAACGPLSPASDWYSVGVMLFEALTGQLPFTGQPLHVLLDKQRLEAPAPSQLAHGVPDDLNALCVALLRRDSAARPTGQNLLDRIGARHGGVMLGGTIARCGRSATPLVGRERHLAALADALETTRQGRTVTVFVHGKSGMGKSALVHYFLEELAERTDAVVLAGRCHDAESMPYKAFDSLVDALGRYLR